MPKPEKNNVMRTLERCHVPYSEYHLALSEAVSGVEMAKMLGKSCESTFKTLVTEGKSRQHYIFMIPVAAELDLKKAAAAVGEKSIEMLKSKDLLPLTGYVHGGCSPIGMKKQFRTIIDASAEKCERIMFSAGKIGWQVEMTLDGLRSVLPVESRDVAAPADRP